MTNTPHSSLPLPRLPERDLEGHKGTYGRVLLVGGSRGMTGAIAMAGVAALRGGAGLVQLAVPDACLDVVAGYEASYLTAPLACDVDGRIAAAAQGRLEELAAAADVVGVGPGLGRSGDLDELVGWLYRDIERPMVLDADALNALSEQPALLRKPGGPRIVTPHPGEFARLIGEKLPTREAQIERAVALAGECGIVVVLKGHRTLVTDGRRSALNTTGNPGMATGGTGDVLTGLIAALVAQQIAPAEAARLGVHLHGTAGDLAADEVGEVSLIASDLLEFLPDAFRTV